MRSASTIRPRIVGMDSEYLGKWSLTALGRSTGLLKGAGVDAEARAGAEDFAAFLARRQDLHLLGRLVRPFALKNLCSPEVKRKL